MTTPNLAKIERVQLRNAWQNEARDFTPWLAANIAELGEALGMDLEIVQTEAPVGGYSLDILATDRKKNRPVIIENQLEATDHVHLGQLLTYAAGFDAGVIVWVTRKFQDEHRQALDWLNQRTGEDTEFFGVAVELWRIGDSLPAPHFRLVAAPNERRKRAPASARVENSAGKDKNEQYKKFFQTIADILRQEPGFANLRNVNDSVNLWWPIPSDCEGIKYRIYLSQKEARVQVHIENKGDYAQLIDRLKECRGIIEPKLGQLDWNESGQTDYEISLASPGRSIDDDDVTLAETQEWIVENLLKFKQVFDPKLIDLAG